MFIFVGICGRATLLMHFKQRKTLPAKYLNLSMCAITMQPKICDSVFHILHVLHTSGLGLCSKQIYSITLNVPLSHTCG
jgi:hypothetical protein